MTPRKAVDADQRAPIDEQPFALAEAEAAGVLPEQDRRNDTNDTAVDVPAEWVRGAALIRDGGWEAVAVPPPEPVEEVIVPSPLVRDLSRAHERVPNDAGSFDYFTQSGEKL